MRAPVNVCAQQRRLGQPCQDLIFAALLISNSIAQLSLHLHILKTSAAFASEAAAHMGIGLITGIFIGRLLAMCTVVFVPLDRPEDDHARQFSPWQFVKRDQLYLGAQVLALFALGWPWTMATAHDAFLWLCMLPLLSQFIVFLVIHTMPLSCSGLP